MESEAEVLLCRKLCMLFYDDVYRGVQPALIEFQLDFDLIFTTSNYYVFIQVNPRTIVCSEHFTADCKWSHPASACVCLILVDLI